MRYGQTSFCYPVEAVGSWVEDHLCAYAWFDWACFSFFRLPTQQSYSPSHCQRGESPASSEEQRRRARQHLDDITAARLLPLHHLPAQLLSIEESLALQKEQKQNYEEMQAKLAAQKLAERLNIKMQSYNPEGESSGRYREVRDEDDAQSSDEFWRWSWEFYLQSWLFSRHCLIATFLSSIKISVRPCWGTAVFKVTLR